MEKLFKKPTTDEDINFWWNRLRFAWVLFSEDRTKNCHNFDFKDIVDPLYGDGASRWFINQSEIMEQQRLNSELCKLRMKIQAKVEKEYPEEKSNA